METYTIKDVVSALEMPRERFKEWVYRGFIEPSVQKAVGLGTKNVYSKDDLYSAALLKYMIDEGIRRDIAGSFVRMLKHQENILEMRYIVYLFPVPDSKAYSFGVRGFPTDWSLGAIFASIDEDPPKFDIASIRLYDFDKIKQKVDFNL